MFEKYFANNIEKIKNPFFKVIICFIVAILLTYFYIFVIDNSKNFYLDAKKSAADGYNKRTEQRSERLEGKINQKNE